MKITTDKCKDQGIPFSEISAAEVFRARPISDPGWNYYLKRRNHDAINVKNGMSRGFKLDDKVWPVEAELVIGDDI